MEKNILNTFVGITGTFLTWLFGSWDLALQVLLVLIVLDYMTGLLRGVVQQNLSSEVCRKGLFRKGAIIIILILAVLLDRLLNNDSWICRTAVAYFYIANEGISIIENCASVGLPVPEKIINVLEQLKDGERKEIKKENKDSQKHF